MEDARMKMFSSMLLAISALLVITTDILLIVTAIVTGGGISLYVYAGLVITALWGVGLAAHFKAQSRISFLIFFILTVLLLINLFSGILTGPAVEFS